MSTESNCLDRFTWLNNDFVQILIQKSEKDNNVILKSFYAENALFGGENFSSVMLRLKVDFQHYQEVRQKTFIVKIAIDSEDFVGICEESRIFEKEIEVYMKILPKVEELLESIGERGRIAPRCYMSDVTRRMMVFEDLCEQQFKNVNKVDGLNTEYMKIVLSALAKWHAATAILLIKKPELFKEQTKKKWYRDDVIVRKFFKDIAKTVSNAARKWEGFEQIADKLINVPVHVYDNVYKSYLPRENEFNTLAHGDMWSNNIMFQHDQNGTPTDIRFVDFALGKYTSPSIDLVCLLYACSHESLKQKDREELIQFYHYKLVELLKRLEYPNELPSLLEIQMAAFRTDWYNVLIVLLVIGVRYVTKSDEFMNLVNGQKFSEMYSQPECILRMKYLLNLFDRRGYFDF